MVDFLGIGVQRGGTSWLYENLVRHPGIWLPFMKEVHFFNRRFLRSEWLERLRRTDDFKDLYTVRLIRLRIRRLRDGKIASDFGKKEEITYLKRLADRDFFMTDAWYEFLFSPAPPGKKTGEVTPFYCAIGETGIIELERRFPAAKMIYLVRDPVERALSCLRLVGERSGADMRDRETVAILADRCLKNDRFRARGDYRSHIPLWDQHFGDRVHYIPFGEIKSDPEGVFRRLESFIGISRFDGYPSLYEPVHVTVEAARIPAEIRRRFAEANAAQYAFLESRFPSDFIGKLR